MTFLSIDSPKIQPKHRIKLVFGDSSCSDELYPKGDLRTSVKNLSKA